MIILSSLSLLYICYTFYRSILGIKGAIHLFDIHPYLTEQATLFEYISPYITSIIGHVILMVCILLLLINSVKNTDYQGIVLTKENIQARISMIKENLMQKKEQKKLRKLQRLKEKINKLESND